jgi:BirA family biotin operon repressor/biotin-[acetyl-CoA-carboxylase] ligase
MPVAEAPQVVALRSYVASLALFDALTASTGTPLGLALKWPNDVLMNSGKVAGILLECQSGPGPQILAIGIGVNLIGHPDSAEVEPGATSPVSVLAQSGQRITSDAFLDVLAPAFAAWEAVFTTRGFSPIRDAWLARAARIGQPIRARTGQHDRHGIFDSIDYAGNLMLRMDTGTLAIPAAEVFF